MLKKQKTEQAVKCNSGLPLIGGKRPIDFNIMAQLDCTKKWVAHRRTIILHNTKNCANEVDRVWVKLKGYTIYCANEGIDIQYYCAMYSGLSDM